MPTPPLRHDENDDEERVAFIRGAVAGAAPSEKHPHDNNNNNAQTRQQQQRRNAASTIAVVAIVVGALVGTLASSASFPPPPSNPPNIPPECVTALGGGVMGPGGSIHMTAGRNDSANGCRSALAAYAAIGGPYYQDVEAAVGAAYEALGIKGEFEESFSTPSPRGVVIFDIDETALSNAPLSAVVEGAPPSSSSLLVSSDGARRVNRADAPALEPTLRLYRALQRQVLAAAFVTGRGEASRQETERNLRAAGYGGQCSETSDDNNNASSSSSSYCYLSLTLRQPGDARPASVYKPEARAAVSKAFGLPVVGSVGDQWSDLSGEVGSSPSYVAIKLPNPFYYIL